MDYKQKLERINEHVKRHPHDYQAVIAGLKAQSDVYEHEMRNRKVSRLQRLAEIRKRMEDGEYGGK